MLRTRPLPGLIVILLPLTLASTAPAPAAKQTEPTVTHFDKKQLQAIASALVDEGKKLEKAGQLDEAHDKFIEAEGYISTGDALDGLKHIREDRTQKAQSILDAAHSACTIGKPADCAAQLEAALAIGPQKPEALHNDLAIAYQQSGDRDNAIAHLDGLLPSVHDDKERIAIAELRTSLTLGVKATPATGDARKKIQDFNEAYAHSDAELKPGANDVTNSAAVTLCQRLADIQAGPLASPAITYNAAKCAEEDGDFATSATLLTQYLKATPDALDAHDVQVHRDSMLSLAALTGDTGTQVRAHFAAAARDLDYRRYDRANEEYQAAMQVAPSFSLTYWRMGLMAEATANVTLARVYLQKYIQLESDQDRKAEAAAHLGSLDAWHTDYVAKTDDAHDLMADLLTHAMGLDSEGTQRKSKLTKEQKKTSNRAKMMFAASETMSPAYVQSQLDDARDDLDEATQLFPIAPEANQMLALLDLEDNDWPTAFRRFDAVAAAGMPVSFYAQETSSSDNKFVRATKIEIGRESLRFVYLSSYNAKKKISEPPASPAGFDDLGNLAVSESVPPDTAAEAKLVYASDLQAVQTAQNFVVVKEHKEQTLLAPVFMSAFTPIEGKSAREFGNQYTRMFVRYLGYENARLGKEGMTFGEKLKLGYSFASTGMTIFEDVGSGGFQSYDALQHTLKLIHQLRTDTATLHRTLADQRRVLEGLQFKPIPLDPAVLVYRDHL